MNGIHSDGFVDSILVKRRKSAKKKFTLIHFGAFGFRMQSTLSRSIRYDKMTSKWEISITLVCLCNSTFSEIVIRQIQMIWFMCMDVFFLSFFVYSARLCDTWTFLTLLKVFNIIISCYLFLYACISSHIISFDFVLWAWATNRKVKGETAAGV